MNVAWVEGRTAAKRFALKINGAAVDLTDRTFTLILRKANGTLVSSPGTVTVASALDGLVDFTPTAADTLTVADGPYTAHFKDVDEDGKIRYFPEESTPDPLRIVVGRAGG